MIWIALGIALVVAPFLVIIGALFADDWRAALFAVSVTAAVVLLIAGGVALIDYGVGVSS